MTLSSNAVQNAAEEARRLYRLRRVRDDLFPSHLFGEPTWDLLLELYIAGSEQRPVSAISASIAASVSTEEVMRLITELTKLDLVERLYGTTGPAIVSLSEGGFNQMTELLKQTRLTQAR